MIKKITQERLKELLSYDPETGVFRWKVDRRKVKAGTRAGALTKGYIVISVDGKKYKAHRLAWLYTYGCWPTNEIDHVNRVKDDNRLCNLRDVTRQQQQFNRGVKGYSWYKRDRKWQAQIKLNGILRYLGLFDTPEEANAAYLAAKEELHKIREQNNERVFSDEKIKGRTDI